MRNSTLRWSIYFLKILFYFNIYYNSEGFVDLCGSSVRMERVRSQGRKVSEINVFVFPPVSVAGVVRMHQCLLSEYISARRWRQSFDVALETSMWRTMFWGYYLSDNVKAYYNFLLHCSLGWGQDRTGWIAVPICICVSLVWGRQD